MEELNRYLSMRLNLTQPVLDDEGKPVLVNKTNPDGSADTDRRRIPIRPVSDRKAAPSDAATVARGLVRDRAGCCILRGRTGIDTHHRLLLPASFIAGWEPRQRP